jgi:hypothetical protein
MDAFEPKLIFFSVPLHNDGREDQGESRGEIEISQGRVVLFMRVLDPLGYCSCPIY